MFSLASLGIKGPDWASRPIENMLNHVGVHTAEPRPLFWTLILSTGTYATLAFLEALQEVKDERKTRSSRSWDSRPTHTIGGVSRLTDCINATNVVVFFADVLQNGRIKHLLSLTPTDLSGRPWTLITSIFVHGGYTHLSSSIGACYATLPKLGNSYLFGGSALHTAAFYLTTGILSHYPQLLASSYTQSSWLDQLLPGMSSNFVRFCGASGALYAVTAAFCVVDPQAPMSLPMLPIIVSVKTSFACLMAFDIYGLINGTPEFFEMNIGHAAHLGGAVLGLCYGLLNGRKRLWRPLVRIFKKVLRTVYR